MDENTDRGARDPQQIDALSNSPERDRPLSPDAILSVVANDHRRTIINSLNSTSNKTLEYETLVDHVADRLREEGAAHPPDEHRRRAQIALTHTHLPKLEEARLIDYETETERVQFIGGEREQDLLTLLESYDAHD